MRASMLQLTPKYSSNRAVREYVGKYYLPAASGYRERAANGSQLGLTLSNWAKSMAQHWANVRFGSVTAQSQDGEHVFEVQVFFEQLDPNAVEVELYAEPQNDGRICRQKMEQIRGLLDAGGYIYSAKVPANRPATDYTPRIIPYEPRAAVPLEAGQILWQR
jgi:starch phosphorylase